MLHADMATVLFGLDRAHMGYDRGTAPFAWDSGYSCCYYTRCRTHCYSHCCMAMPS